MLSLCNQSISVQSFSHIWLFVTLWTTARQAKLMLSLCNQSISVQSLSHVWLFVTLGTTAHQAPLSMGFSRQEYWSESPVTKLCITSIIPILLDIYFKNLCISMHRKERIWSREINCLPEKKGDEQVLSCFFHCQPQPQGSLNRLDFIPSSFQAVSTLAARWSLSFRGSQEVPWLCFNIQFLWFLGE